MSIYIKSEHLMNTLLDTLSMCEHCYRHTPATRFERDNQIWLGKTCPEHGYHECLVEIDAEFYNSQVYEKRRPSSYWLDITNRCNLDCPHCYQIPDNLSKDPTVDWILNQVMSWDDDGAPLALVGAEPTTRKDLADIIEKINNLPRKQRLIMIVTNGINLGKRAYAGKFTKFDNVVWTIGLNHPDYNGGVIRQKQEEGIKNCQELGLKIKNMTYTLGDLDQLDFVLDEMQHWYNSGAANEVRIQVGVEIGRTPDGDHREYYLSDLVKHAKKLCLEKNYTWEEDTSIANRTHYAVKVNGVTHRFIKWCDVKTIDLEETQSESWANLIPHKPMSPLLHQVILRDRFINNRKPLFDTVPEKYTKDGQ
mgnify:FL=1|jgi:hypothetical protein